MVRSLTLITSVQELFIFRCPAPPVMPFATGSGDTIVGRRWTYTCNAGYEIESGLSQVSIDCVAPGNVVNILLVKSIG